MSSKATIYLEQDGEVIFTHKASGARDDEEMVDFAIQVWRLSGMTGYKVGPPVTARVEWDDEPQEGAA